MAQLVEHRTFNARGKRKLVEGSTPSGCTINMEINGITLNGKFTIRGLGKLYYEKGIPLSIIFDFINEHDYVISWLDLVEELKENGFSLKRIYHLLHENIFESFGKEYRDEVLNIIKCKFSSLTCWN